jgi:hypothetical protein
LAGTTSEANVLVGLVEVIRVIQRTKGGFTSCLLDRHEAVCLGKRVPGMKTDAEVESRHQYGRESSDIKRKYPAQNIDFADDQFSVPCIDRSEVEAQKHLLDRSIAAHGGFEDA